MRPQHITPRSQVKKKTRIREPPTNAEDQPMLQAEWKCFDKVSKSIMYSGEKQ